MKRVWYGKVFLYMPKENGLKSDGTGSDTGETQQ